jgi:predicted MFS family arabinose efflux permease
MIVEDETAGRDAETYGRVGVQQWYALTLLTLMFAVNSIDRNVLSVVQEQIKHEFVLTDSQLGVLHGLAFGATYAVFAIPLGLLADRVSRRNLLAAIMALWSLATAAAGFAGNYGNLLASRMMIAAAESGTSPAATSLISDLFPPNRRATAVAIFFIGPAIGLTVSFLFGGLLAAAYGWRAAFLVAGIPGLVLSALLLLTLRDPKRGGMDVGAKAEPASAKEAIRHILGNPTISLVFAAVTLSAMGVSSMAVWAASMLIRNHGLPISAAGAAVAVCVGISSGLGVAAGGPLADRYAKGDPRRALRFAAGAVLTTLAFAVVAILSTSTTVALVGLTAFGATHLAYVGPSFGVVLNASHARLRGVTIAMLQICVNLIGGLGPWLIGVLSDAYGGPQSLRWALITAMPELVAACILYLLASHCARRTAGAPAR